MSWQIRYLPNGEIIHGETERERAERRRALVMKLAGAESRLGALWTEQGQNEVDDLRSEIYLFDHGTLEDPLPG